MSEHEQETLEYQSHVLVEGVVKEWVKQAAEATREGAGDLTASEAIQRMQWLYLAEPHLITKKILDALKLSGWTAPEGVIAVDYSTRAHQVIPEAAVQAATRTLHAHSADRWANSIPWEDLTDEQSAIFRTATLAVLETAAMHMKAAALEEAAQELDGKRLLTKPFHEYYPEWLRARAAELRAK
jgi:hypothetical protein